MSDVETIPLEPITLETEIAEEDAAREIEKAVIVVKGLGSKIGGAAGSASEGVKGLFKKKERE